MQITNTPDDYQYDQETIPEETHWGSYTDLSVCQNNKMFGSFWQNLCQT